MSALTIRLPGTLKSKLSRAAKRLGKSPEQFVRDTLQVALAQRVPPKNPSLYDLSRDLRGTVTGAPTDLARNKARLKGYGSWKQ